MLWAITILHECSLEQNALKMLTFLSYIQLHELCKLLCRGYENSQRCISKPNPTSGHCIKSGNRKHAPTHTQNKPTWGGGTRLRENHHTVWYGNNGKYWEWNICPHQWEHKQLSSKGDCQETAMSVIMSQNSWVHAAEKQWVLLSKGHCGYCVCVCVCVCVYMHVLLNDCKQQCSLFITSGLTAYTELALDYTFLPFICYWPAHQVFIQNQQIPLIIFLWNKNIYEFEVK